MLLEIHERYVIALNLLLVGGIAYFAALSVNDIVAARLAAAPVAVLSAPPPVHAESANHPRRYYDIIVRRDVFNLTPAPELSSKAGPVVSEDLHVTLLGTSHFLFAKPFAIFEDARTREQSLYRVGDQIPGAGQLVAVEKDRAIILHDGRRVAVEIPQESLGSPIGGPGGRWRRHRRRFRPPRGASADSTGGQAPGVREVGANRYVVDRSVVDSNLQNMAPLLTQIRAMPNLENGRTNGFTLSEIESGSIFDQIGLKDGDVLTRVQGQEVNDPAKALELLGMLRTQNEITLDVVRNGAPVEIRYDIQ